MNIFMCSVYGLLTARLIFVVSLNKYCQYFVNESYHCTFLKVIQLFLILNECILEFSPLQTILFNYLELVGLYHKIHTYEPKYRKKKNKLHKSFPKISVILFFFSLCSFGSKREMIHLPKCIQHSSKLNIR